MVLAVVSKSSNLVEECSEIPHRHVTRTHEVCIAYDRLLLCDWAMEVPLGEAGLRPPHRHCRKNIPAGWFPRQAKWVSLSCDGYCRNLRKNHSLCCIHQCTLYLSGIPIICGDLSCGDLSKSEEIISRDPLNKLKSFCAGYFGFQVANKSSAWNY